MRKYKLISLECWGNKVDGFSVNDAHYTGTTIDLNYGCSDADIVKALKSSGAINKRTRIKSVGIDGCFDYGLYINDVTQRAGGFLPLYELRPEDL